MLLVRVPAQYPDWRISAEAAHCHCIEAVVPGHAVEWGATQGQVRSRCGCGCGKIPDG